MMVEEMKTVQCTGRIVQAGTTLNAQPKLILYAQRNKLTLHVRFLHKSTITCIPNVDCYVSFLMSTKHINLINFLYV